MPKVHDSRIVPLPREQVYKLMMDIEKYPSFIPFIRAAKFLEREDNISFARIHVGIGHMGFSYKCRIEENPFDEILIREVSGPFSYLHARLTFEEKGANKTRVGYDFESRFRSRSMNTLIDPMFNLVLKSTLRDVEKYIRRKYL